MLSRRVGGQREFGARRWQDEGVLALDLFATCGDILVVAVLLLREHRHIASANDARLERRRVHRLQVGTDAEELQRERRVLTDVVELRWCLVTDDIWHRRHHHTRGCLHAATTIGFEGFRREAHREAAVVETLEREIKLGLALVVRLQLAEIDLLARRTFVFIGTALELIRFAIVEGEVSELIKVEARGAEVELAHHATIRCGSAEQGLQLDRGLHIRRRNPRERRWLVQCRGHLHAIRLEVFHAERHATDLLAAFLRDDAAHGHFINARRIALGSARRPVEEAIGSEIDRFLFHFVALRVIDFHFERQVREFALPVATTHDGADVNRVARTIHTALGEDEGAQALLLAGDNTFRVEARHLQPSVVATKRHEGEVVADPRRDRRGFLLAAIHIEVRQHRVALRIGRRLRDELAVLREHSDCHRVERLALAHALHEHIARVIFVHLRDDAEIGDEDEATMPCTLDLAPLRDQRISVIGFLITHRPRLHAFDDEEEHAPRLVEIGAVFTRERGAEIERRERGLILVAHGHFDHFAMEVREVLLVHHVAELRLLELALIEAREVVHLARRHAPQRDAHVLHAARFHREFALAIQCEHAALAEHFDFLRELWHDDIGRVCAAQNEATERRRAALHLHQELAGLFVHKLEAVPRRERCAFVLLGLDELERHRLHDARAQGSEIARGGPVV